MTWFARLTTFAALGLLPFGAAAASVNPDEVVQAAILTGWQTQSGTHMAALDLKLADHWKTYWRAPGDAGIPPSFDWTGSQNVARVAFHWPRPEVFHLNGMQTVGYLHRLVLPMEFTPKDPSQPMVIRARMDIGVCNDICMPVELRLKAELSGKGKDRQPIRQALAEAPVPTKAAVQCQVAPISDGLHLTARIAMPALGGKETALIETSDPTIWVGAVKTQRDGKDLVAAADLVPAGEAPFALDRSQVRITVLGATRAVDIRGCTSGG
ncbi:MAG: hypothetical protein KGN33_14835 [Paracoccaceae bacterium]|nr:hypothetical protein [Paracoccaceae bacterium]